MQIHSDMIMLKLHEKDNSKPHPHSYKLNIRLDWTIQPSTQNRREYKSLSSTKTILETDSLEKLNKKVAMESYDLLSSERTSDLQRTTQSLGRNNVMLNSTKFQDLSGLLRADISDNKLTVYKVSKISTPVKISQDVGFHVWVIK